MWLNFKVMPMLLKFITGHAIFCVVFVMSAIPGGTFKINGQVVSHSEWWSSGAGPFALVLGILMPITGVLLLQKSRYARPAYIAVASLALVLPYLFMGQLVSAFIGFVVVGLLALYLYFRRTVLHYFASNHAFNSDGPAFGGPAS